MKNKYLVTLLQLLPFALTAGSKLAAAGSNNYETATFAAGCFWGTEEFFRKVPGVTQTQVGYTGGHLDNPSYQDTTRGTSGHAESIEIQFDPKKISYRDLLIYFFKIHDPTTLNRQGNDVGTQYRSAIFYHDEKQKNIAEDLLHQLEKSKIFKTQVSTELSPAKKFYRAEDYHQLYLKKNPDGYDNHIYKKELPIK